MEKVVFLQLLGISCLILMADSLPIQKDSICSHKVADIVFALDSSQSIWEEDFKKQLEFVKNLVKDFPIREHGIHVGVVTYGHFIYENFGLKSYFNLPEITSAINRIQYVGGGTNTGGVIKYAREQMFDTHKGGRDVDQIMFVITDGYSMNSENTTIEASISRSYGIKMIAVGVGHNVDEQELNFISATDSEKRLMFRVDDFSALETIQAVLAETACKVINTDDTMVGDEGYSNSSTIDEGTARKYCGGKPADIYFIVDASSSIWPTDFGKILNFIADTMDTFDLGADATRIGVVVYSDGIHPVITINNNFDLQDLKTRIRQIPHLKGGTETGSALHYLRTYGFADGIARDGVAHIGIVLTDGQSADIKQTMREAVKLKDMGTYLYVIGIGRHVDEDELKAIASDPDEKFIYRMENFDALSSIKNILAMEMCTYNQQNEEENKAPERECTPASDIDVMFVFDAFSIGVEKSQQLTKIVDTIMASTNSQQIRSGVLTHSCNTLKPIPLSSNTHSRELLRGLDTKQSDNLPILLNELRTNGFTEENGDRPDAENLVILFVDGNLDSYHRIKMAIKRLTFGNNADIYVVGVGERLEEDLTSLAAVSEKGIFLQLDNYMDTSSIEDIIVRRMCENFTLEIPVH